jgi:hypothetical protein
VKGCTFKPKLISDQPQNSEPDVNEIAVYERLYARKTSHNGSRATLAEILAK